MGASGSLFTATIVRESFIPATCWIAPLIPSATYSSGATTFPVCPTCCSLGASPASTTARDAPTAPPRWSARSRARASPRGLCIPRPAATTTFAERRSGRAPEEASADPRSSDTQAEARGAEASAALTTSSENRRRRLA